MSKLYNYLKENYILLSILFVSSFLRIYRIDFQSVWIDEVNTFVQSDPNLSFSETYETLKLDLQPPLYFYLLKIMLAVFGYTTFILRLFSALFGVAGVYAVYILGKELYHKKAGIYASLVLCFNYFHIYYSQEARPYSFLFFFTTLSFYYLIRFIKAPSNKRAIAYGITSCLMLYGHPYGIFSFFSQYVILLICFIQTEKTFKLAFFKHIFLAGFISIVLYIPAIQLFLNAANISSFWIPMPGPTVFTLLLNDFFGYSEFLMAIVYLLIIFVLIKVFSVKEETNFLGGIRSNKLFSGFVVLTIWITICILIPFIRSHLQIPMIVPRYLIGILPAIVILISIGLAHIEQKTLRTLILALIIIFSLTDIQVVRRYYKKITKSQLREITGFIKENNKDKTVVISELWWFYGKLLNTADHDVPTITPLDFINGMMQHPEQIRKFWYCSGHGNTFDKLPDAQRAFLNEKFNIVQRLDLFDAWALLLQPKNGIELTTLNLSEFQPLNSGSGNSIFLYNETSTKSKPFTLKPGNYTLLLEGMSEPAIPINQINAHVTIKLNDRVIGGTFLSGTRYPAAEKFDFYVVKTEEVTLEILFDNDLNINNKDRNALIYSIKIENEVPH